MNYIAFPLIVFAMLVGVAQAQEGSSPRSTESVAEAYRRTCEILLDDTVGSLRRKKAGEAFLERFPDGPYAEEVRELMKSALMPSECIELQNVGQSTPLKVKTLVGLTDLCQPGDFVPALEALGFGTDPAILENLRLVFDDFSSPEEVLSTAMDLLDHYPESPAVDEIRQRSDEVRQALEKEDEVRSLLRQSPGEELRTIVSMMEAGSASFLFMKALDLLGFEKNPKVLVSLRLIFGSAATPGETFEAAEALMSQYPESPAIGEIRKRLEEIRREVLLLVRQSPGEELKTMVSLTHSYPRAAFTLALVESGLGTDVAILDKVLVVFDPSTAAGAAFKAAEELRAAYPNSPTMAELGERLEAIEDYERAYGELWELLLSPSMELPAKKSAVEMFLTRYPRGEYSAGLQAQREEIDARIELFRTTFRSMSGGRLSAFEVRKVARVYLAQYPIGSDADRIRQQLLLQGALHRPLMKLSPGLEVAVLTTNGLLFGTAVQHLTFDLTGNLFQGNDSERMEVAETFRLIVTAAAYPLASGAGVWLFGQATHPHGPLRSVARGILVGVVFCAPAFLFAGLEPPPPYDKLLTGWIYLGPPLLASYSYVSASTLLWEGKETSGSHAQPRIELAAPRLTWIPPADRTSKPIPIVSLLNGRF